MADDRSAAPLLFLSYKSPQSFPAMPASLRSPSRCCVCSPSWPSSSSPSSVPQTQRRPQRHVRSPALRRIMQGSRLAPIQMARLRSDASTLQHRIRTASSTVTIAKYAALPNARSFSLQDRIDGRHARDRPQRGLMPGSGGTELPIT